MQADEDRYYRKRAEEEAELARTSAHPAAAESHHRLAEAYRQLLGHAPGGQEPGAAAVTDGEGKSE